MMKGKSQEKDATPLSELITRLAAVLLIHMSVELGNIGIGHHV